MYKNMGNVVVRTGIGIRREVASPGDEGLALVLAGGDGVGADGGDDGGVAQLGLSRDDGVGDVVVDALWKKSACIFARHRRKKRTECSSCLTSRVWPSLKVHWTMSVSGDAPLTNSLFSSFDQNLLKSWSLIRCQTALKGASMTADSLTEVVVGMAGIVRIGNWFLW